MFSLTDKVVRRRVLPRSLSQRDSHIVEFERFISSHRFKLDDANPSFYAPCPDGSPVPVPSHNDLFGGMLKVDDRDSEVESAFHDLLVKALRSGGLYGLCENRTRFSAMYFDLDFKGTDIVTTENLIIITQAIRDVLHRAGAPESMTSAVIATSPPKQDAAGEYKCGAHLIFPDIILGYTTMVRINLASREHVETMFGPRLPPHGNTWTDVFDTSMYRTGLRMLYVDKNQMCLACQQKECNKAGCRNGFVGQKRPYTPVAYIGSDGTSKASVLHQLLKDKVFALHRASIRRPNVRHETPALRLDDTFPLVENIHRQLEGGPKQTCKRSATAKHTTKQITDALCEGNDNMRKVFVRSSRAQKVYITATDPRMRIMQTLVRAYEPRFKQSLVQTAYMLVPHGKPPSYVVTIKGHGRHNCMNRAGGPHSRSTVYFSITMEGISQRCTSRSGKTDNRTTGKVCSMFGGPVRELEPSVRRILFDDHPEAVYVSNVLFDCGKVWLTAGGGEWTDEGGDAAAGTGSVSSVSQEPTHSSSGGSVVSAHDSTSQYKPPNTVAILPPLSPHEERKLMAPQQLVEERVTESEGGFTRAKETDTRCKFFRYQRITDALTERPPPGPTSWHKPRRTSEDRRSEEGKSSSGDVKTGEGSGAEASGNRTAAAAPVVRKRTVPTTMTTSILQALGAKKLKR